MARELNEYDQEVLDKLDELRFLICDVHNKLSDIGMGQRLIDDVQILTHIWTKNKGSI